MSSDLVHALGDAMLAHNGLILICAPTGQGKTQAVFRALEKRSTAGARVLANRDNLDEPTDSLDTLQGSGVAIVSMDELRRAAAGSLS